MQVQHACARRRSPALPRHRRRTGRPAPRGPRPAKARCSRAHTSRSWPDPGIPCSCRSAWHVLLQVVIRAVGNAPKLAPAEGEQEFKVRGGLGIEGQLLRARGRAGAGFPPSCPGSAANCGRSRASNRTIPDPSPGLQKNSSSICSNSRMRKIKLPGVISLRKDLPIWPMPTGIFLRVVRMHVLEVDEDALRGLGAQIHLAACCPRLRPGRS